MTDQTIVQQFIARSRTHRTEIVEFIAEKLGYKDPNSDLELKIGYATPTDPILVDLYEQIVEQNPNEPGKPAIDKEYIVIPYGDDDFTFLNIDNLTDMDNQDRPKLPRKSKIYNAKALTGEYSPFGRQDPVLVCFNIADCLAYRLIHQSTIYVNYREENEFIDYLNVRNIDVPLILTYSCFGNAEDRPGITTELVRLARRIKKGADLETVNITSILDTKPTENHFIRLFRDNYDLVRSVVLRDLDEIKKIVDTAAQQYRQQAILNRIPKYREFIMSAANRPRIGTGLPNLDTALNGGLSEGLYIFGAASSTGKTTLCTQLADNIARTTDVLFFTLEQSRAELMSKSVSRQTYLLREENIEARTYTDIMYGSDKWKETESESFERALNTYQKMVGDRLFYFEKRTEIRDDVDFDATEEVDEATGKVRRLSTIEILNRRRIGPLDVEYAIYKHREFYPDAPLVVFIDYIQVMAPLDVKYSDKQNIDATVSQLRYMASQYHVPIVAISSLNRASTDTSPGLNALNGSGNLEYGADIVGILRTKDTSKKTTVSALNQNRIANDEAKKSKIRELEFDIIKNRYGICSTVYFTFNAMFSTFSPSYPEGEDEEDVEEDFIPSRNKH